MFNGPCQLHGGRGSSSAAAAAMAADDDLLTPDGFDPFPHGRSFQPLQELIAPPAAACSADHCLMNPQMTCPDVYEAMQGIQFMAEHTRREQYTIRVHNNFTTCITIIIPFISFRIPYISHHFFLYCTCVYTDLHTTHINAIMASLYTDCSGSCFCLLTLFF